jgi:hypothetical protein
MEDSVMSETSGSPERADSEKTAAGIESKYSCVVCHKRKVKCDRGKPCANCVRNDVVCEYKLPPAPKRRGKHADRALMAKIQKYEEHLRKIGATIDESGDVVSVPRRSSSAVSPSDISAVRKRESFPGPANPSSSTLEVPSDTISAKHSHSRTPSQVEDGTLIVDAGRSRFLEK